MAQVKRGIAAGALQAGDGLPSLRQMAARLRINPLTVAKAYRELEASGVVVTEHGRGTFISSRTVELGEQYRRQALADAVDGLLIEAHRLGASAEDLRSILEGRMQALNQRPSEAEAGTFSVQKKGDMNRDR